MFTGIVADTGTVRRAHTRKGVLDLRLDAGPVARSVEVGDSVAVSGVCLTAVGTGRRTLEFEAMGETLGRTTLGAIARGDRVNLELPVRPSDRLGGHIVQGHVDAVGKVTRLQDDCGARRVWLAAPEEALRYLIPKGSVAIDGVSLTVVDAGRDAFQVALIPHTLQATTLALLEEGSLVNLEVDMVAKYVERLVDGRKP